MARRKVFSGSYIDGLSVDLIEWAGVTLTDEQHDHLWGEYNEVSLLELCDNADIVIEEEIDDQWPGMNDTYYAVFSDAPDRLKEELRAVILSIVR